MSLQQRQPPVAEEADLEVTAELPVLDVAAYEPSAPGAATADIESTQEREPLGRTDTWHIPSPSVKPAKTPSPESNSVIDENRARLEVNLQALSATLRDVEERLTRKDERLVETELALETAIAEKNASELRSRALSEEANKAEGAIRAAQTRIAELQKTLQ